MFIRLFYNANVVTLNPAKYLHLHVYVCFLRIAIKTQEYN